MLTRKEGKELIKNEESDPALQAKYLYLMEHMPGYTTEEKEIVEHHIKFNKGDRVNLEELTDYGATNPSEAFAEAFLNYVEKGPKALNPWIRNFFIKTLAPFIKTILIHRDSHQYSISIKNPELPLRKVYQFSLI